MKNHFQSAAILPKVCTAHRATARMAQDDAIISSYCVMRTVSFIFTVFDDENAAAQFQCAIYCGNGDRVNFRTTCSSQKRCAHHTWIFECTKFPNFTLYYAISAHACIWKFRGESSSAIARHNTQKNSRHVAHYFSQADCISHFYSHCTHPYFSHWLNRLDMDQNVRSPSRELKRKKGWKECELISSK